MSAISVKGPKDCKSSRMLPQGGQQIALTLLARRDYSQEEMGRKLEARGIPREEIERILQTLRDQKLLDDHRYARRWASSWVQGKLLGPLRIKMRLRQKGISEAIVKETLMYTEEIFPTKDRARKVLAVERKQEEHGSIPLCRKKKLVNLLRQKGYDWEDIFEVLQESGGFAEE